MGKKAIDSVMKEFDFEHVHDYMTEVGWEYYSAEGVPDIARMKKAARSNLETVVNDKDIMTCQSGGFFAMKTAYSLRLFFVIESKGVAL